MAWIALVGVAGCGDTAADDIEYMDDDLPAGGCRDTESVTETEGCDTEDAPTSGLPDPTGSVTSGVDDSCVASEDCMGGVCAAAYDPVTEARDAFICNFACIPQLDEGQWCSDDASCCDADAVCTARGYCIIEGLATTDDGGGSTMNTGNTGSTGSTGSTGTSG